MSTWTKQNLFELGAVTRGKSKHHHHPHPAAPRSKLRFTTGVSPLGLYRDGVTNHHYLFKQMICPEYVEGQLSITWMNR